MIRLLKSLWLLFHRPRPAIDPDLLVPADQIWFGSEHLISAKINPLDLSKTEVATSPEKPVMQGKRRMTFEQWNSGDSTDCWAGRPHSLAHGPWQTVHLGGNGPGHKFGHK